MGEERATARWVPWLAIAAFALLLILPALLSPLKLHDSFWIDWVWVDQFGEQLRQGQLYPRWLPASHDGLGSPVFYYYPPLAFYPAGLLAALRHGAGDGDRRDLRPCLRRIRRGDVSLGARLDAASARRRAFLHGRALSSRRFLRPRRARRSLRDRVHPFACARAEARRRGQGAGARRHLLCAR